MTTNVRVRVPKVLLGHAGETAQSVKGWLQQALTLKLTPVHTTSLLCVYVSVYLGPALASDLELAHSGEPLPRICQGLLAAMALHQKTQEISQSQAVQMGASLVEYFHPRPEQTVLFEHIKSVFTHKEAAALLEAGTGTGKGRVLMSAALYAFEKSKQPVVVCAPTIQIISQLCEEYLCIEEHARAAMAGKFSVRLGKDNFISEYLLQLWLHEGGHDETHQAITAWLANGAGQTSEKTSALHTLIPGLTHLFADAREVAPDVPWGELTLSQLGMEDDADRGMQSYDTLTRHQHDSGVVLASHSMVVIDAMQRKKIGKGLLPPFQTLFIDEAHTFAGVAENTFSKSGAIRSILVELSNDQFWKKHRKLTQAQQAIPKVKQVADELAVLLKSSNKDRVNLTSGVDRDQYLPIMNNLRAALLPLINVTPSYSRIMEAFDLCCELNKGRMRVEVQASPVRSYPSIQGGPSSLTNFFEGFWEPIKHAVLASATCYVPGVNGQLNAGHLISSLNLTKRFGPDGVKKFAPISPPWLYQSVKVYETKQPLFCYPLLEKNNSTVSFDQQLEVWYATVSEQLRQVYAQALGGTLVLLPSYEAIDILHKQLNDVPVIAQALGGFSQSHREFLLANHQGRKVIWLATGSAWTGLDCSDRSVQPERDTLLTDLVIPKIPFGVERSLAHLRRQHALPTTERDRALFQFKQGIGRLVRREGLLHRNLWILDARIYGHDNPWLYKPFKALLAQYSNREWF